MIGRMRSHSGRQWRLSALTAGLFTLLAANAYAWKPETHVASANELLSQFERVFKGTSPTDTLVFNANNRQLNLQISRKTAYDVILAYPDYFRAGAIGADGFPDLITGQILMHGDGSPTMQTLVSTLFGRTIPTHDPGVKFENRGGPAEYRAIDFPMSMLDELVASGTSGTEHDQTLAFILGYLVHGAGDGFGHTWVNEITEGAWSFTAGQGIFGPLTEEIQHVAVEGLVDSRVPQELVSVAGDQGGMERVQLKAPHKFLDTFYAARAPHAALYGDVNGDMHSFLDYYSNIDQFRGGLFYNFFNMQMELAPALRRWSGFSKWFDLAEDIRDSPVTNFFLDTAELPAEIIQALEQFGPSAWFDELTGGYVDCYDEEFGSSTWVDDARDALNLVGGVNDRVAKMKEKARVARLNYMLLAECTATNAARATAADFDPAKPEFNRDACADLVRAGWTDEGRGGLERGSIRPGLPSDEEFLTDLKAAFLGGSADDIFDDTLGMHVTPWETGAPYRVDQTMEGKNQHRSLVDNVKRTFSYLKGVAFTAKHLDNVVLPDKDSPSAYSKFELYCKAAHDDAFQRCLNIKFIPIAATARAAMCEYKLGKCAVEEALECGRSACYAGCGFPFGEGDCRSMCGGERSGCSSWCYDNLTFCIPYVSCGIPYEPVTYGVCQGYCATFGNGQDSCTASIIETGICAGEEFICEFENIRDTMMLDNYADELLSPVRKVCDVVSEVRAFAQCVKGDPAKSEEEQQAARKVCVVDKCTDAACALNPCSAAERADAYAKCAANYGAAEDAYDKVKKAQEAISKIMDALLNRPPHEIVNLVFIEEDLKKDPTYASALIDSIRTTRSRVQSEPPSPERDRKLATLDRLDKLVQDIKNMGPGGTYDPLVSGPDALQDAADIATDATDLGLMPTVYGPTARRIVGDIGNRFTDTFDPFYNTLQGGKLVALQPEDINTTFATNGVPTDLLPWKIADDYSAFCSRNASNAYCDVIASFDDPNCYNCTDALKSPAGAHGWVPGRGIVAFNKYNPNVVKQYVNTRFLFASSDSAYENLYTKIFRAPSMLPSFAGMDDSKEWSVTQGNVTLGNDTSNTTQGAASLSVTGCGYYNITSRKFNTTEWGVVGDKFLVDVFIPRDRQGDAWVGDLQMSATIRGAGINSNHDFGNQSLNNLPRGAWSTLTFNVSPAVRQALLGDYANATFTLEGNIAFCKSPILIDNLRPGGTITERRVYHILGSTIKPVTSNSLFGFERGADWSSSRPLSPTSVVTQGTSALAVDAQYYAAIQSRPFSTTELTGVTKSLSIDVYIPKPTDAAWTGDVSVVFTCGGIYSAYAGPDALTFGFWGEYNTLRYTLRDDLVEVLSGRKGRFDNCQVVVNLNVAQRGNFYLDNMGFSTP